MTQWYFRNNNKKELGPVSPSELLELIRQGTVRPETELRKGDHRWLPASQIAGLFEAAARPSVVFNCPHCSKPIDKPPCKCRHCHRQIAKATGRLIQNHVDVPLNRELRPDLD